MEKDFINGTFLTLVEQHRIKEAADFCKRVCEEAPSPEFKCIALRNLSELHFFHTGDAVAARQANLDGLAILDANMDLVFHSTHVSEKTMKRIYSDLCEQFRAMAISFDEYEEYAHKARAVRQMNDTERRGLKAVADMRARDIPWKEDMFLRIGDYFQHQAFGQAASILSLILVYNRQLRINADDMNTHSLPGYAGAVFNLVAGHMNASRSKRWIIDENNLSFIIARAQEVVAECGESRTADPAVIESQQRVLADCAGELADRANAPGTPMANPTPGEIDADFPRRMSELTNIKLSMDDGTGSPQSGSQKRQNASQNGTQQQKQPLGCLIIALIINLAGVGFLWYWAYGVGDTIWYKTALAVASSLILFFWLIAIVGMRKQQK